MTNKVFFRISKFSYKCHFVPGENTRENVCIPVKRIKKLLIIEELKYPMKDNLHQNVEGVCRRIIEINLNMMIVMTTAPYGDNHDNDK